MSSKKNTLINSMMWKMLERSSVQIISLLVQIVLARLVRPEQFGSLSIILVFYNIGDLLVQKGFGSALIRKETLNKKDKDSVFLLSSLLSILCFGLLFVLAPYIGGYYNDLSIVWPLRAMGISLLLSPLYCVCNSLLIRNMQFKKIFIRGFVATTVSGTVGIVMALQGGGLWSLVGQMIANQFMLTILMCISTRYIGGFQFSRTSISQIFSFGKNVLVTELLLTVLESIRSLLIGKVYSTESLAYYDRGQTYPATLMRAINDTLFATLLPYFSRIQNNLEELKNRYRSLLYCSSCIVFPVFIGLAAVSDNVIVLLLTGKWKEAIPYMQIFCIYQSIFTYQIISKSVLYAIGDSKKVLKLEVIKSFVSFVLMILSFFFGPLYVAASLIIVRIISDYLYVSAVKAKLGKLNAISITRNPIISSIAMYIVVFIIGYLSIDTMGLLVVRIVIGAFTYCAVMLLLDRSIIIKMKDIFKGRNC